MVERDIRVLCYGDSNTWAPDMKNGGRFDRHTRWAGVLQDRLGPGVTVIEEGLSGRTTVRDDPYEPYRNGLDYLQPCLLTHDPLDLVVLMLGTNDLKSRFNVTAEDVGRGVALLCDCIGLYAPDAKVLIVAPAPLGKAVDPEDMFGPGVIKSQRLARIFAKLARERGFGFFDAGEVAILDYGDGIHLDAKDQRALGNALADQILASSWFAANAAE